MNNIFNAALKHLSTKNCSKYELISRLESQFSSTKNIDKLIKQTIARLEELHLINDAFYAQSIAERYQHKGDRFIKQKLQQKVFDEATIESTLQSIDAEFERALVEAQKKLRSINDLESKARDNKLLRFLSSRGFSAQTCYQVINTLKSDTAV